jgi:hypothetical protein
VPFIYSGGGLHPDHDSINSFRKRFVAQLEELFVQILLIAPRLGVLKLGDIFIEGSQVEANASKHKALSWAYANKLEAHILKPRWKSGWRWPRQSLIKETGD